MKNHTRLPLLVTAAVFALYSLPVEAVAYAGLLCLMLGLVLFALGYSAFLRRHRELEGLLRKVHESVLPLPPPRGVLEADYQALLRAVCADRVRLAAENRDRLENCYYNDLYLEFRPAGRTRLKPPSPRPGCSCRRIPALWARRWKWNS
jgi:hypothetical protein